MLRWRSHDGIVEFFEDQEGNQAVAGNPVAETSGRDLEAPGIAPAVARQPVEDTAKAVARQPVEDTAKSEAAQGPGEAPAPVSVVVERKVASSRVTGRLRAGKVTFWHMYDEYGFIRPDERGQPDVWVSVKALEGFAESLPHLATGERVLYEATPGAPRSEGAFSERQDRQRAIRVLPAESRMRGRVGEYSFMLGHGSIIGDAGTRFFLHRSEVLEGDYSALEPGDEVFFTLDAHSPRSGADPVAKAVKLGNPRPALHRFAQFPRDSGHWLALLAKKAEPEEWSYRHEYAAERAPYPILYRYLTATFERLLQERRCGAPTILEGATAGGRAYAIFNTGLVDGLDRPIHALFDEHQANDDPRKWWWRGFLTDDEGPMREVAELSSPADYLSDPRLLTITPAEVAGMRVDTKHIVVDHLDRFPERLRSDPALARQVFDGALRELPDRIRRNYRLAVAQYYRGSVHLLLPLHLGGASRQADLALVVERTDSGARRASTVLGLDHAYRQARVIARPALDWLGQSWLNSQSASPAEPPKGESRTHERRSVDASR